MHHHIGNNTLVYSCFESWQRYVSTGSVSLQVRTRSIEVVSQAENLLCSHRHPFLYDKALDLTLRDSGKALTLRSIKSPLACNPQHSSRSRTLASGFVKFLPNLILAFSLQTLTHSFIRGAASASVLPSPCHVVSCSLSICILCLSQPKKLLSCTACST